MIHRLTLDPQSPAWQRAIDRALANDYAAKTAMLWAVNDQYGVEALYGVASNSMPGAAYEVHIVDDDDVSLTCTCPAGEHGQVCWHMASVGLLTKHLSASQPDPEPAPVDALKKLASPTIAAILDGSWRRELLKAEAA